MPSISSLTMSEESKNKYLDEILEENESYLSKVVGKIPFCSSSLKEYSINNKKLVEKMNVYAYFGLTDSCLTIASLSSLNVTVTNGQFKIPLSDISSIEITKKSFSYIITAHLESGNIQLSLPIVSIGTNIKNQRQNVEQFVSHLRD